VGWNPSNILGVPRGSYVVRLQHESVKANYSRYQAALQTVDHKMLRQFDNLRMELTPTGGKYLVVSLASIELPPGIYILSLSGLTPKGRIENIHDYAFRVMNQPRK